MATRADKGSGRATKKRAEELAEEAQNVGADIIPVGTIEVTSTAGGSRSPAASPASLRDHRLDQIAPVADETHSLLSDWDLHLFNEGTHRKLWEKLGSHIVPGGVIFGVWAPNAERVSVIGDFNAWDPEGHRLEQHASSGLWEGF